MTIRSLLRSIDARLARLERNQQIIQCCPSDGEGNQIPILIPREPPQPLPSGGDGRCRRIAQLLWKSVFSYNRVIEQIKFADYEIILNVGVVLELLTFNVASAVRSSFTQLLALRFIEAISEFTADVLRLGEDIDFCRAARAYSNGDDVVAVITESVNPAAAVAYRLFYELTGGISWGENTPEDELPDLSIPDSCCYPDEFQLVPATTTLVCGNDSYSLNAIADTIPSVAGVIVSPGVVRRSSLAGRYLQQVQAPGSFKLWLWFGNAPDLSLSCQAFDLEIASGRSYRVSETGSAFLIIRNRTDYDYTYLTCTREPQYENNVTDI